MAISKESLRVRALEVAVDLCHSQPPAKVVDAARLFLDFLDPKESADGGG